MTQAYNLSQLANNLNTAGQLDATDGLVGAVPAANGGTGQASYTVGDLLYASGTTALAKLADIATGNALISGGVGAAPSYGKVGLTTHVSGTLPVTNGGTGLATITANAVLIGAGTSNVTTVSPSTSGNVLTSNGTAWVSAAASSGQTQYALFASSGTGTCPAGVTRVKVTVFGGGGGGSAPGGTPTAGGRGGLGANYYAVVPGTGYAVTIGVGGNSQNSGSGSGGGTTSFAAFISATGGTYGGTAPGTCANSLFNTATISTSGVTNIYTYGNFTGIPSNSISGTTGVVWNASLAQFPGAGGSASAASPGVGGVCFIEYVG